MQRDQLFKNPIPLAIGDKDPTIPAGDYLGNFVQATQLLDSVEPIAANLLSGSLGTLMLYHGENTPIRVVPDANDIYKSMAGKKPPFQVSLIMAEANAYGRIKAIEEEGKGPVLPKP